MAIQSFNVGIKAAIVRDGKILAVKHKIYGTWSLPGGRIDDKETIEQTLRREVREELGLETIEIGDIICAVRDPIGVRQDGSGLLLIAYHVTIPTDSEPKVSDEHSELAWLSFEDAARDGLEIVQEVVRRL